MDWQYIQNSATVFVDIDKNCLSCTKKRENFVYIDDIKNTLYMLKILQKHGIIN